ncbi:hypothetical protein BESB_006030 [Besnoitia besnoiti]|uniref:Uncharacterized protein n=1 Tax=Besnoitia besnoiti TaxID=94643 RepID=A0A2A9MQH5_BESBE|nr:hypothetical protein BESB_006030 [Besnoitia besnoiti]PFH38262.1 hypothetical protein BESB_006030 [Besnoitia besnoiti]
MDVDVPQTVKDYRRICHPEVGRTTCSVAGPPNVSSGFSFGAATRHDFASAENCLKGFYSVAEQLPDVDLGKPVALRTLARGIRSEDDPADAVSGHTAAFQRFLSNPARRAQEDRRLGVPSCRTDIAAPKKRRIDDRVNYNDEPSVGQLLAPGPFEELGVLDEAFLIRRTRDDLLSLVQKSVSATYADKRVLEQAVDTALKRTAEEQSTSAMNEKEASASLMDVLDVFVEILGEQVARETCS